MNLDIDFITAPEDLTWNQKLKILIGSFESNRMIMELKFSAFIAAVECEKYHNDTNIFSDMYIDNYGKVCTEYLRDLIMCIPNLSAINELLERNLSYISLNPEIIDLFFWIIIYSKNLMQESIDNFLMQLMEVGVCEVIPKYILKFFNSEEDDLLSLPIKFGIKPKVGYYNIKLKHLFKNLVHGFTVKNDEPVLLNKKLDISQGKYENVWENAYYFRKIKIIAACNLLPNISNNEEIYTEDSNFIRVYNGNFINIKYLLLFVDNTEEIEKSRSAWIEEIKSIMWGSAIIVGLIWFTKSVIYNKTDRFIPKFMGGVAGAFKLFLKKLHILNNLLRNS